MPNSSRSQQGKQKKKATRKEKQKMNRLFPGVAAPPAPSDPGPSAPITPEFTETPVPPANHKPEHRDFHPNLRSAFKIHGLWKSRPHIAFHAGKRVNPLAQIFYFPKDKRSDFQDDCYCSCRILCGDCEQPSKRPVFSKRSTRVRWNGCVRLASGGERAASIEINFFKRPISRCLNVCDRWRFATPNP